MFGIIFISQSRYLQEEMVGTLNMSNWRKHKKENIYKFAWILKKKEKITDKKQLAFLGLKGLGEGDCLLVC